MNNSVLLRLLDDSIIIEEMAVPIYSKHINSALFWSGFEPEEETRIKEILTELTSETKEHVQILTKLKNKIGGKNV